MYYLLEGKKKGRKYRSILNVKPGINKVYLGNEVKVCGYRNIKIDRITKEKASKYKGKGKAYLIPNVAKGWRVK